MTLFHVDPALFYLKTEFYLPGHSGSYVDDLIRCENSDSWDLLNKTRETFEMKEDSSAPFDFIEFLSNKLKIEPFSLMKRVTYASSRNFL